MNAPRVTLLLAVLAASAGTLPAQSDWRDRVDQALTFGSADRTWRANFSGTLDVTAYHEPDPVSDLYYSDAATLVVPRLTAFVDAQLGANTYLFAQSRVDRGFDPGEGGIKIRLDEYALRWSVWKPGRLSLQLGKFATVVGNWTARHSAWDNPLVSAPLPYDNLTGLWDIFPAPTTDALLVWAHVKPASIGSAVYADKNRRIPIIWGPAYTTGAALAGGWGHVEYAFEFKNAAISSRPEYWDASSIGWSHPSYSGRVGVRPDEIWNFGVSFSDGEYLSPDAIAALPPGLPRHGYRQITYGQDASFAWHHFQAWAEVYEARYENPVFGSVGTIAGYLEAKYKFTPQFAGAIRWNQQHFDAVRDSTGQEYPWSRQVSRLDLGATYRFSPDVELKLQYSLRHEDPSPEGETHTVSAQWVLRF